MSYAEVLFSKKEEDVRYVKWSRSHMSKAEGFLKGWCMYVHCHALENQDLRAGPVIPDTSTCDSSRSDPRGTDDMLHCQIQLLYIEDCKQCQCMAMNSSIQVHHPVHTGSVFG